MDFYQRKLYALLSVSPEQEDNINSLWSHLTKLNQQQDFSWWQENNIYKAIASSSDRLNLKSHNQPIATDRKIKHPISGQPRLLSSYNPITPSLPPEISETTDAKQAFWWFWRFYPELMHQEYPDFFLYPAHEILPDCPLHSYKATVSALVGAMYPQNPTSQLEHPYLILFTFSPVQEFIKASRKFLDFWAGSYLLHYLGAKLAWYVATKYGPDTVITPSLWGQEIIDAWIVQRYPQFKQYFQTYTGNTPQKRFETRQSHSLSTAGFPNIITALVPGVKAAEALGKELTEELNNIWTGIGYQVRDSIRETVINTLEKQQESILADIPVKDQREVKKWLSKSNWQWNKLWQAQLSHTWESYWTAIPLGHPQASLSVSNKQQQQQWLESQQQLAQSRQIIPTTAETKLYESLNVGTWWGSLQQRLGQSIQAVKNTRKWRIPPAPGERSTLSGQYSAVHPNLLYNSQFQEGGGVASSSLQAFWQVMAVAFPGLFNSSEKLNAIELTKRMAWVYGGVAESLEIPMTFEDQSFYENSIRFPNLSSIASARFAYNYPHIVKQYWYQLKQKLDKQLPKPLVERFAAISHRPYQIPKTDKKLNPDGQAGKDYNGIMFSSKWLAEDLGLAADSKEITSLRESIDATHRHCGFGESSPSDWWVIVVGDGDSMGQYVSGRKLKNYQEYLVEEAIAPEIKLHNPQDYQDLLDTRKRMGPASHVGLNRALLDFSNRLVPYLAEKRCCGRVIYSGGDDVLAVLPLEDLTLFLRSLRACWSGEADPLDQFTAKGGYWTPTPEVNPQDLTHRPYFTMGEGATMSLGIVIAHKSVPLPTVLTTLWEAEKDRAKKLRGAKQTATSGAIPPKDGLCFRVIYSSGNILEALIKGHLLPDWCQIIDNCEAKSDFAPLLYRLAAELPPRCALTENMHLFREAAQVFLTRREDSKQLAQIQTNQLLNWLDTWENWAYRTNSNLGNQPQDLGYILRLTAFLVTRLDEREKWGQKQQN